MSCSRWILNSICTIPVLAMSAAAFAGVGGLADIEVYDRTSGRILPVTWHEGRHYIAGQPGHEYELRIRNRQHERVMAVASVDGVNVITGQTASPRQSGYVLDRYGSMIVSGWRKDMSRTAAFYFTALPDSYAARTGRPHDVGVIGVALFREAPRYPAYEPEITHGSQDSTAGASREQSAGAPEPAAPVARSEGHARQMPQPREKLGTGHGRSEWSSARYTQFERLSGAPDEVITIYYDSRANLIAQGIMPVSPYEPTRPRAFPAAGFVPDP
jgi:hypothetical protein